MRFECWVNKAKNTHSEYVILTDISLQQWSHERFLALTFIRTLPALFHAFSVRGTACVPNSSKFWTELHSMQRIIMFSLVLFLVECFSFEFCLS